MTKKDNPERQNDSCSRSGSPRDSASAPPKEESGATKGKVKPIIIVSSSRQIADFMACLEAAGIKFRKNELGHLRELDVGEGWRGFTGDDDGYLAYFLEQRVLLKSPAPNNRGKSRPARFSKATRTEGISAIYTLKKNCYHPTRDYLNSLTPKIDEEVSLGLLHMFTLGQDDELSGFAPEHVALYAKHWLESVVLGIISRAFNPGATYDLFPILRGDKGCGKSLLWKNLLPPELEAFIDAVSFSSDNKELSAQCQYGSLVEFSELAGNRRKENQDFKAWLSATKEMIRYPYAKYYEPLRRNFVPAGSSNESESLANDPDGDRRTLIAPVSMFREGATWAESHDRVMNWLNQNRDKLFAHGLALYKAGQRGLLSEFPPEALEIRDFLAHTAKRRNRELDWAIKRVASGLLEEERRAGLPFENIRDKIYSLDGGRKPNPGDNKTLSVALLENGWTKQRPYDKSAGKRGQTLWFPPPKTVEEDRPLTFVNEDAKAIEAKTEAAVRFAEQAAKEKSPRSLKTTHKSAYTDTKGKLARVPNVAMGILGAKKAWDTTTVSFSDTLEQVVEESGLPRPFMIQAEERLADLSLNNGPFLKDGDRFSLNSRAEHPWIQANQPKAETEARPTE